MKKTCTKKTFSQILTQLLLEVDAEFGPGNLPIAKKLPLEIVGIDEIDPKSNFHHKDESKVLYKIQDISITAKDISSLSGNITFFKSFIYYTFLLITF